MPNQWNQKIVGPKCIVTGCDASHEWILPWWYQHYSKHNEYPVIFADFGLSSTARNWCKERGTVIQIPKTYKKNWFKKPTAILMCPYEKIIWMDTDCEVRASLEPLFTHADIGVGVTKDPYTPFCKKHIEMGKAIATGVIVAKHGDKIITKWADRIDAKHKTLRGDQEAFNSILEKIRSGLSIMPREYQWLRRDGDNKDAIIMHWTGPKGKNRIKKTLQGMKPKTKGAASRPAPAPISKPMPMRPTVPVVRHKNKIALKQRTRLLRKPK